MKTNYIFRITEQDIKIINNKTSEKNSSEKEHVSTNRTDFDIDKNVKEFKKSQHFKTGFFTLPVVFWITTIVIALGIEAALLIPNQEFITETIFDCTTSGEFFESIMALPLKFANWANVWGMLVVGLAGVITYNSLWAESSYGDYKFYHYFLSVLVSLLFIVAYVILVYIIAFAIAIALLIGGIALICSLISGG